MASSDFTEILSRIFNSLFYILPLVGFVILAIYYLSKVGPKTEALLILIGNVLILLIAIIHQFMYRFIDTWGFELYSYISIGVNAISFLGSLLFLIGFLMLIRQHLKTKNS